MGNEESLPSSVDKARFYAFKTIRQNLSPSWSSLTSKKFDYLVEPTSTKDNGSALHALFGVENSLGYYETHGEKRKEVCKILEKQLPIKYDLKTYKFLKESLSQYFETEEHETGKSSNSLTPNLDSYARRYFKDDNDNDDPDNDDFPWGALLHDVDALKEYFKFLSEPQIPFLKSDLLLIAHVFKIPMKLFDTQWNLLDEVSGSAGKTTVLISMDDGSSPFEFSRVTSVVAQDESQMHSQILSILNEVYLLEDSNEIELYLAQGHFGDANLSSDEVDNEENLSKSELVQGIIHAIDSDGDLGSADKLRLQMALAEMPKVCLRVVADRIYELGNGILSNCLRYGLSQLRDFGLNCESYNRGPGEAMLPVVWTMASCFPGDWVLQLALDKLAQVFAGVKRSDMVTWRMLLNKIPLTLVQVIMHLVGWEDPDGDRTPKQFGYREKKDFTAFLKNITSLPLNLHTCDPDELVKLVIVPYSQWPLQIPKIYIFSILDSLPGAKWDSTDNKKSQALYYLYSLYNLKPAPTLEFLHELKKALKRGGSHDKGGSQITSIICKFSGGWWDLGEEAITELRRSASVHEYFQSMTESHTLSTSNKHIRSLDEVMQIISSDGNSSLTQDDMCAIKSLVEEMDSINIPIERFGHHHLKKEISSWLKSFKKRLRTLPLLTAQMECLAYVNVAMKVKLKFADGLRPCQKFAIVSALYLGSLDRSMLSQMSTGEGKTSIVLALAIIRGVFGQPSDIVTSSEVLARRDAAVYRNLYGLFDLTVGEVTSPYLEVRKTNYKCTVVYGTSTHFKGDYIRDLFHKTGTRGTRPYLNVIIDEVDSMLLDNGIGVVYISHNSADWRSLEDVLVFIWTNVVAAVNSGDFQPAEIHEKVMRAIYRTVEMDDLSLFLRDPGEVKDLWEWIVSAGIINEWGRLQIEKGELQGKLRQLPKFYEKCRRQLKYLLEKTLTMECTVKVLNHLKPLVDRNLYAWIDNAFWATQWSEGVQYVVDVTDHSDSSSEDKSVNAKITPINQSTGVDQVNTTWNEGLHQSLELKQGCKLGTINSIAIFVSCITYFKLYERKFGLTGTMGTPSDRKFLQDTYKVEFLSVPLAQAKRFEEEEPVICPTESKWMEEIYKEIIAKTVDTCRPRSVLTICRNIKTAESLHAYLLSMGISKKTLQLYIRDYQKFKAAQSSTGLEPGQVLIATNLAGRGTDIKLSKKLRRAGGLHVILSYLPASLRVEQQALGRAARSGDPGSGKIIFYQPGSNSESDAIDLKILRDEEESTRVAKMLEQYEQRILKKEQMFDTFKSSYNALDEAMEKVYKKKKDWQPMKKIILSSVVDKWSLWLDEYTFLLDIKRHKDAVQMINRGKTGVFRLDEDHIKRRLNQLIGGVDSLTSAFEDKGLSMESREGRGVSFIDEPGLMVKAAKVYIKRGKTSNLEKAVELLDKVLCDEEDYVSALYYKLHCLLRLGKWSSGEFEKLSKKVVQLLEDQMEKQYYFSSIVSQIKCITNENIVKREGYQTQKENEIRILSVFKSSIDRMVGNEKISVPQDLGGIKELKNFPEIATHLEKYLCDKGVLLEPEFQYYVDKRDEKIQKLADQFFLEKEKVRQILRRLDGQKLSKDVEKTLKNELKLPYRGGFWNDICTCLQESRTYAVVKRGSAKNAENQNCDNQNDLVTDLNKIGSQGRSNFITEYLWNYMPSSKPIFISKYGVDKASSMNAESVIHGSKSHFKSQQKYKLLKKQGLLLYETVSTVNVAALKKVVFSRYYKVDRDAFTRIDGVSSDDSRKIFDILVKKKVISGRGELLSTEWTNDGENRLDLTVEYEVFRADILAVLQNSCRYKYELLSLIQQVEEANAPETDENGSSKENYSEIRFSLPFTPWKDFLMASIELGFCQGLRPSPSFFRNYGGIEVFQEPSKWCKWVGGKLKIGNNSNADDVPYISYWDLHDLFPSEEREFLIQLHEDVKNKKWLLSGENIPRDIQRKYKYYLSEITPLIQWKKAIGDKEFIANATKLCFEARGKLRILDNPDAELVPLKDYFGSTEAEQKVYSEEIECFEISGFDLVIDTVERKYTWKMIGSAFAVFLLGLVQVVVGVLITFFTLGAATFIGRAFIQEGIGDMIYSAMSFWSGRFSWQDYINSKWQSIAITAVTMGLASLLSRAVKYSKYGARLFGVGGSKMGGRAVNQALKEGAKTGVRRTVWSTLTKSVAYKVLQSGALAVGSMAVSYAYEKVLSQAVQNLVNDIFSKMYDTAHQSIDSRLKGYMSTLCDKTGSVHRANVILTECLHKVLSNSAYFNQSGFLQSFLQIQKIAWAGIMEATGKVASARAMSSQAAASIMIVGKICSGVSKITSVISALDKLGDSVDDIIKGVAKELRLKLSQMEDCDYSDSDYYVSSGAKHKFVEQFKKDMDKVLNQGLEQVVRYQIVEPLMNMGCQKLLTDVGRCMRGCYREAREGYLRKEIRNNVESRNNASRTQEEKIRLEKKLLNLCAKARNPETVALAVENGIPLGKESLQVLANAKGVRIVVKSENGLISDVIEPVRGEPKATLHMKHTPPKDQSDQGHWESSTGNESKSQRTNKSDADCLLHAFNEELRQKLPGQNRVNRKDLASNMRKDAYFKYYVKNGLHHSFFAVGGYGGARKEIFYPIERSEQKGIDGEKTKQEIKSYREELEEAGKIVNVEGKGEGPVKERATTKMRNKKGKNVEVLLYQSGEVKPEHLKNLPKRPGADVKNQVFEEQDADSCDQAGHNTPQSQRGPPTVQNLFPQHPKINQGVDNAIAREVNNFLRANKENNPSVKYQIQLIRGDDTRLRPTEYVVDHEYWLNGQLQKGHTYRIPNPRARRIDFAEPPRKQYLRRGRGI